MSIIQVKTTVPGLGAANSIMAKIKSLGIQDIELMWDKDAQMWAVMQVFKPSGKILLMNTDASRDTAPLLMWWCRNPQTLAYRDPNEQDIHDVVVTIKRAEIIFDKGSDWMIDNIEDQEKATYAANRKAQSEKIRSIAKPLKKAFKKEVG